MLNNVLVLDSDVEVFTSKWAIGKDILLHIYPNSETTCKNVDIIAEEGVINGTSLHEYVRKRLLNYPWKIIRMWRMYTVYTVYMIDKMQWNV